MNYGKLLEHSFKMECEQAECPPESRLEYLSQHVFDFVTYESSMDELFARKAVEVCDAITSRKTFEYIAEPDGRIWYLLMCNMPFFAERLEWGTSIRGAWWAGKSGRPIEFQSCGLWSVEKKLSEPMRFSVADWEAFVGAVVAFAAPEMSSSAGGGFAWLSKP